MDKEAGQEQQEATASNCFEKPQKKEQETTMSCKQLFTLARVSLNAAVMG